MPPLGIPAQPLPRRWQSSLQKIRRSIAKAGLLHVIDSFLPGPALLFHEAILRDTSTLRLYLGNRQQEDGLKVKSWAYVCPHTRGLVPSIVIRDEVQMTDQGEATFQSFPRAATTLLRKATELDPPFRFLQFDPSDKATNVRGMVCALISYYFLEAGLSDHASSWRAFEDSLLQALRYIEGNVAYHLWGEGEPSAAMNEMNVEDLDSTSVEADDIVRLPSQASTGNLGSCGSGEPSPTSQAIDTMEKTQRAEEWVVEKTSSHAEQAHEPSGHYEIFNLEANLSTTSLAPILEAKNSRATSVISISSDENQRRDTQPPAVDIIDLCNDDDTSFPSLQHGSQITWAVPKIKQSLLDNEELRWPARKTQRKSSNKFSPK